MAKSADEQIKELREKRDQLNARIQKIQARENAKARKARTHRLIQVGATVESVMQMELDTEESRTALMHALERVVSVYDPARGANVDTRVADIINTAIHSQTAKPATSIDEPTIGQQDAQMPPSYQPLAY